MVSYIDTISEKRYVTTIYDKRDTFNFNIVNFPFMDSNRPAYGVYISQLLRVGRICESMMHLLRGI